jgi:hypothetical protein
MPFQFGKHPAKEISRMQASTSLISDADRRLEPSILRMGDLLLLASDGPSVLVPNLDTLEPNRLKLDWIKQHGSALKPLIGHNKTETPSCDIGSTPPQPRFPLP